MAFSQGTLHVSKHRAQAEASVSTQGFSNKSTGASADAASAPTSRCVSFSPTAFLSSSVVRSDAGSSVLVCGFKNRNRAVHGDVVVVELLPRSEWRGKATALSEGQGDEKSLEESGSQPLPTGGSADTGSRSRPGPAGAHVCSDNPQAAWWGSCRGTGGTMW